MSNAATQAALGIEGQISSQSVTNRRGSLALSSRLPNTMSCDKEIAPRAGGIRVNGNYSQLNRSILIVELPAEILVKIMNYMSFNEISQVRLVSTHSATTYPFINLIQIVKMLCSVILTLVF